MIEFFSLTSKFYKTTIMWSNKHFTCSNFMLMIYFFICIAFIIQVHTIANRNYTSHGHIFDYMPIFEVFYAISYLIGLVYLSFRNKNLRLHYLILAVIVSIPILIFVFICVPLYR